jgi:hypothetical protein
MLWLCHIPMHVLLLSLYICHSSVLTTSMCVRICETGVVCSCCWLCGKLGLHFSVGRMAAIQDMLGALIRIFKLCIPCAAACCTGSSARVRCSVAGQLGCEIAAAL